jgi:hypothetical protein
MHALEGGHPHDPRELIHDFRGRSSTRSKGGYPRALREVFHTIHPRAPREAIHALRGRSSTRSIQALRGRRKVIHALQGGSSMRSKGGDPHAAREVIQALRGSGSTRSEGGVPRASMGRDPRALRATIHDTFRLNRFLISINPDSDSTLEPSRVLMLFQPTH